MPTLLTNGNTDRTELIIKLNQKLIEFLFDKIKMDSFDLIKNTALDPKFST